MFLRTFVLIALNQSLDATSGKAQGCVNLGRAAKCSVAVIDGKPGFEVTDAQTRRVFRLVAPSMEVWLSVGVVLWCGNFRLTVGVGAG